MQIIILCASVFQLKPTTIKKKTELLQLHSGIGHILQVDRIMMAKTVKKNFEKKNTMHGRKAVKCKKK